MGEGFEVESGEATPLEVPQTHIWQRFAGIAGPCVLVDAERSAPASECTALMLNASRARAYIPDAETVGVRFSWRARAYCSVLARTGWKLNVIRVD